MFTPVQIINLGIGLFASAQISRIDPPGTSLEKYVGSRYLQQLRSELTKRRWVFATAKDYVLTLTETKTGVDKPYVFALPTECLRPIRGKGTEWEQSLRFLHSAQDTLVIDFVKSTSEDQFDPLFVDVLAARIAVDTVEYVTQSNSKSEDMKARYRDAVADAGKVNAFVRGPEDNSGDDSVYPFLTARI